MITPPILSWVALTPHWRALYARYWSRLFMVRVNVSPGTGSVIVVVNPGMGWPLLSRATVSLPGVPRSWVSYSASRPASPMTSFCE